MRKEIWIGAALAVIALIPAAWVLSGYLTRDADEGLELVFLEDGEVLVSNADVLSYNLTSQEIAITAPASERLSGKGDSLYRLADGFAIRIDGEEIYRGAFRRAIYSAIPGPPNISILFPSMLFPSEAENPNAIRMFYPSFEPPSDQPEANAKFCEYFEEAGKLIH